MTKEELESLGLSDRALESMYVGRFGGEPILRGSDLDGVRRFAFDAVMELEERNISVR